MPVRVELGAVTLGTVQGKVEPLEEKSKPQKEKVEPVREE